jgi:hypothetical protein
MIQAQKHQKESKIPMMGIGTRLISFRILKHLKFDVDHQINQSKNYIRFQVVLLFSMNKEPKKA